MNNLCFPSQGCFYLSTLRTNQIDNIWHSKLISLLLAMPFDVLIRTGSTLYSCDILSDTIEKSSFAGCIFNVDLHIKNITNMLLKLVWIQLSLKEKESEKYILLRLINELQSKNLKSPYLFKMRKEQKRQMTQSWKRPIYMYSGEN